MPESGSVAGKKYGFAGIDFILPADDNEWSSVPGMGPMEPRAWLFGLGGSADTPSTFTGPRTWGLGLGGQGGGPWTSESWGRADVQHKGADYCPDGVPFPFS